MTAMLVVLIVLNVVSLALVAILLRRSSMASDQTTPVLNGINSVADGLSAKFTAATADMASRLEQTKGDLRQQLTDRLTVGFNDIRAAVDQQIVSGRAEQLARLDASTSQLEAKFDALRSTTESKLENFSTRQSEALLNATNALEQKFEQLKSKQAESLESIRAQVDQKLLAITENVQQKLDANIKEGFAHFEKVQEHLKAAEEQLRNVGALGTSINELNNVLRLPHMRGKFGEASLERLLSDFLPASMFELQKTRDDGSRPDALILFPDRKLPIDSKFPREQVMALFESSDPAEIATARENLSRVIKVEAKRIAAYIQPEEGTTDVALMYLPSETLFVEVIRDRDLSNWLNEQHVFPVSPNTLLLSLQTISLVYRWYQAAETFKQSLLELGKAQKHFGNFDTQFRKIGSQLDRAQDAYNTATKHLSNYRNKVTKLTGEEVPELGNEEAPPPLLAESAKA